MGVEYISVQWNRQKKFYDAVLIGGVALYLALFGVVTEKFFPLVTDEIMLMRAFGTAAFLLLHVILCIGPLCRLNPKFLPLLYNRRHAGVTMFLLALIHAVLVITTYHAAGDINPILSIFVSSPINGNATGVPFQPFGFFALVILFLMAATSHDFWLANLSAPVWKSLHMMVYVAYALLILHVTFGVLQGEGSPVYVGAVAFGLVAVVGLHIAAARRETPLKRSAARRIPRTPLPRPPISSTPVPWSTSPKTVPASFAFPVNAWPSSNTKEKFPRSQMCASTRTGRSVRAKSFTDASRVRGTVINISRTPAHRRRPSSRRFLHSMCA